MRLKKVRNYRKTLAIVASFSLVTPLLHAESNHKLHTSVITQQSVKIQGTIVDAKTNEPIIGANVVVANSTLGTSTDIDGQFTLDAPIGSTLEISYIGYAPSSIKVQKAGKIEIKLQEDTKALEEVVVVGYGVQKKESLTGAMQVVSDKQLKDVTTPTVENMLSGKAPGVYVNSGSGRPGDAAAIVIRGKSTVNGSTDPLWVVDGVIVGAGPGSVNPSDIESMTILKDAASTAIYGSQGANGVIIVTTKKGKTGKATFNFDAKLGITQLNKGNFEVMNGAELYDYYKSFGNQEQIKFPRWNNDLRYDNYDWWDNATQLGFAQDYNFSVSGGTEDLKIYSSLGIYDEDGAVKGYNYKRYSFAFNADYRPLPWLTIRPQVNGSRKDIKDRQHSVSAMYMNMPWDSPYNEDGSLVGNAPNPTWVNTTGSNYLYDLQWNFSEGTTHDFAGSFNFDIKLADWIKFTSTNNYKYTNYYSTTYSDPRSSSALSVNGRIQDFESNTNRIYSSQMLNLNKNFGLHALSGVIAYDWNEYNYRSNTGIATGFAPGFEVADVAAVPEKVGSGRLQSALQSFITRANYSYDNKYIAEASFRRDGASNFGVNAKYGNFFSLSGGWNINREKFFTADWVNQLKLRASYGSVGNRPSDYYPQYALYSLTGKYNELPGALISQAENANITWEKSYTAGVGVDFMFLERFNVSVDYYNKNTSDLLYQVPLPGVIGITSIWRNVGSVINNGFELVAGAEIIQTKDWNWRVDANFGLNRNKVGSLYGGKSEIIVGDGTGIAGSANKLLRPGLDVDSWYLTEWAGVDPATGAPQWYTTNTEGERVITKSYSEASKNPIVIDKYTPDFFGGFSTNLSWRKLDLSANFGYSVGGKIYNYARAEFDSDGAYTDRNQMKLQDGWNRWEKEGDIATHPLALYNNNTNSNKASSRFLEDGSYLKLRNLTIGYTIQLPKYYIANLRIYASGENLFTITNYSGVDPEIPPVNGRITGVATTVYPSTRKFMFGINLTL
ncbi:MAG: SusC/RagA family TonB-linked outer membrane protein [Tannerellaceae bacterium]